MACASDGVAESLPKTRATSASSTWPSATSSPRAPCSSVSRRPPLAVRECSDVGFGTSPSQTSEDAAGGNRLVQVPAAPPQRQPLPLRLVADPFLVSSHIQPPTMRSVSARWKAPTCGARDSPALHVWSSCSHLTFFSGRLMAKAGNHRDGAGDASRSELSRAHSAGDDAHLVGGAAPDCDSLEASACSVESARALPGRVESVY